MECKLIFTLFLLYNISLIKCYESGLWLKTSCTLFCIGKGTIEDLRNNSCSSDKCIKCSDSCNAEIKQPCSTYCSNLTSTANQSCSETCHFLKERSKQEKPGTCSSVREGFELIEVAHCTTDNDCIGPEKCCSHEKSKTCQQPEYVFSSTYPPVPIKVSVKLIESSLLVSWRFPLNSTWKKPTMFIIEKRQSSSLQRPSNRDFSFWTYVGKTTSMQMEVMYQHLVPRDWYQMRVLAFSLNGTNGFSKPSRSVRLNIPIRRPHPPRNFTATGAWFQNGKIFVKISWSPPRFLRLPVRKYRILYYKQVVGTDEHYVTVPVITKKVSGRETSTVLTDLQPDALYDVKIQALSIFRGRKRVKGEWNKIQLKTPPISAGTTVKNLVVPTSITDTTVELKCMRTFYSKNGLLSAVVRWRVPGHVVGIQFDYSLDKCKKKVKNKDRKTVLLNARRREIQLVDLYEDCRYFLQMKTYFADNSEAPYQESLYFSTYPAVKTTKATSSTASIAKLNSKSWRLEYSCSVLFVSFLILISNLVVYIL